MLTKMLLIISILIVINYEFTRSNFIDNPYGKLENSLTSNNPYQIRIKRNFLDTSKKSCRAEVSTKSLIAEGKSIPKGNGTDETLSILEVCCDGYKPYKYNNSICVPDCQEGCKNGLCVEPNVCICAPGYVKNLDDECIPECPFGCLNGKCHANGTCTCNPYFKLDSSQKLCLPICIDGCVNNMRCLSPGKCGCSKHHELNSEGICVPVCKPDCINGKCIDGKYCSCYHGFTFKDGVCQARCSKDCINGYCVLDDVCMCKIGYTLIEETGRCEPVCRNCEYGTCAASDDCRCYPGYKKVEDTCKPICDNDCENGYCVEPKKCLCNHGYSKNPSGNCKQLHCTGFFSSYKQNCTIYHLG